MSAEKIKVFKSHSEPDEVQRIFDKAYFSGVELPPLSKVLINILNGRFGSSTRVLLATAQGDNYLTTPREPVFVITSSGERRQWFPQYLEGVKFTLEP